MNKKLLLLLFFFVSSFALAQIKVTFQVNMDIQIKLGAFKAGTDKVVVRGSFQKDAGHAGDWGGTEGELKDADGDKIYTVTVTLPTAKAGTDYEYKFVTIIGTTDGWEGVSNRKFKLDTKDMTIAVAYFNDVNVMPKIVKNTLKFVADVTSIAGSGVGYFDVTKDTLNVKGFAGWGPAGESIVSGDVKLKQDQLQAGTILTTQLVIKGPLGGDAQWKFKANPDARWVNTGWEQGLGTSDDNRHYTIIADSVKVTTLSIKPLITPASGPLKADRTVLFSVDLKNALNSYDNSKIPLDKLEFVGVKGEAAEFGAWAGDWVPADTTAKNMLVLNDAGKKGDKVAKDNKWSITVVFKAGVTGGQKQYKYGAQYPGTATIAASRWMDNERKVGDNHKFNLQDGTSVLEVNDTWLTVSTSIERTNDAIPSTFSLSQNYPNPFNPTTVINYQLPKSTFVNLKVYNSLGQEVVTVVDKDQVAGTYSVTFDPYGLSSGVYYYTLRADGQQITKKMLFIK